MEKYSANYAYTNHNFTIQNIVGEKKIDSNYYPIFCVLKNILHRGSPTIMSQYLQEQLGCLHESAKFKEILVLIDKEIPIWEETIKGDDDNNNYPAKDFFEKYIPKYLGDYKFIQQLIIPEVSFNEIIGRYNEKFINQRVDFYLPQAKLVIEIDGSYHKEEMTQFKDEYRDEFLKKNGVQTVRIDTIDLYKENSILMGKFEEIKDRLEQFDGLLNYYKRQYEDPKYYLEENTPFLTATAIIRFQTLILSLLEKEILNINDPVWNINILNREVHHYEEIAIKDIFIWLEQLFKLKKLPFNKPKVNIKKHTNVGKFKYRKDYINIDFSLLKRWTDENNTNSKVLYVRTDYFDRANYFQVSTSDPIKYPIIEGDENSDIPILKFFLKNLFGFDEFNEGQLPIIINSLACNDTIGLLPTGSGKSLCYQLTALLQPCISFIVCPIKSLMYDQKDNLDKYLITRTNYISSDQDAAEKQKVGDEFGDGKYLFIWISPERFQIQSFRDYLGKINKEQTMALAVIDEVHCLSEWGHDFRTSYLNLVKTIREYCPTTWFLGLTATASSFVLEDLKVEFEIEAKNIKTLTSFTRPELRFYVRKDNGLNSEDKKINLFNLLEGINKERNIFQVDGDNTQSGLIFTLFKNGQLGCYKLSNAISSKYKINAKWYSGEVPTLTTYENGKKISELPVMEADEFEKYKMGAQKEYKENKFPLLVATKAFGMGIDKKNIRYTVHYGIPNSLEGLYQEAGRAGRDKEFADCYILYSQESLSQEELDVLFHPNTKIQEIRNIQKEYGLSKSRDILRNFFLWLTNNNGVEEETQVIKDIYKKYAETNKVKLVKCKDFKHSFSEIQKAIYRLSLVGIVQDWTIESWNRGQQIIKIIFNDFTAQTMEEVLFKYIRRYDREFELDIKFKYDEKYGKYNKIYYNESISQSDKIFTILLEWTYENIVYNRRQSMKNIFELCENYTDSESFKEEIERYFKFTDKTYILDNIAHNPKNYEDWFEIFYSRSNEARETKKQIRLIDIKDVEDIKGSLSRLLESYRYNTGLNFISGISRLILNDYDNQDGKMRLESAFQDISNYDEKMKLEILDMTLNLKHLFDEDNIMELSKLLCENYPEHTINIYEKLKDSYSLNINLEDSLKKLKNIGGWIS